MNIFKKAIENRIASVHENYLELDENSLRVICSLNSVCDENNIVDMTSTNMITELANISDAKYTKSAITKLIESGFINVEGDYKKANSFLSIELVKNETRFGLVKSEIILQAIKDLNYKELKVLIAYYTFSNSNLNRNYVYPSNIKVLEVLNETDTKYFEHCKNELLRKGYILKVACLYQYIENKDNSSMESNGYFLKTGIDEVTEYMEYVKDMISKKNKKGGNFKLALTNKGFIERKYKNSKTEIDYSKLIYDNVNEILSDICNSEIITKKDIEKENKYNQAKKDKEEYKKLLQGIDLRSSYEIKLENMFKEDEEIESVSVKNEYDSNDFFAMLDNKSKL